MYALVDANAMYVSCERSFCPRLEGKAVIVLSNRDGCVIARSDEAKALGIKMGTPFFELEELRKQHPIEVFSSNYALYGDMSSRLMSTLTKFVEEVEVYSIDEAFLHIEGYNSIYPSYRGLGESIRATVNQWLRLPVCVGFGPTKTMAKVANRLAKKNPALGGVCVLESKESITKALADFPVEDLWGVGRKLAAKLKRFDIRTAAQLRAAPIDWIRQMMTVNGVRLVYELQGKPCKLLEINPPAKKALCTEPGFNQVTVDLSILEDALTSHLIRLGEKLRKQDSLAGCVTVYLKTNRFRRTPGNNQPAKQYYNSRTVCLPHPTSSAPEMLPYALAALKEIFRFGYHYQKVGLMLTDLVPTDYRAPGLFSEGPNEKQLKLAGVVDKLNRKFGRDKLRLASQQANPEWSMQCKFLSKCYTTRWEDVLEVY